MEQLSIIEVTGLDDNFDDNSIGGVQMDVTMSEVQDLYRVGWSRVPRRNRRAFKTQTGRVKHKDRKTNRHRQVIDTQMSRWKDRQMDKHTDRHRQTDENRQIDKDRRS